MPSLEIYDDGFRIYIHVRGKYDCDHFDPSVFMNMPAAIVKDNLGNYYDVLGNTGGGGIIQNAFNYDFQLTGLSINPHAKELFLTINEILFQGIIPLSDTTPPMMTKFRYSDDVDTSILNNLWIMGI
jgi:hypothetical protein